MTDPKHTYEAALKDGSILPNANQAKVVKHLQSVYQQLKQQAESQQHWLKQFSSKSKKSVHGIYLWGDVGIGKTYLLDLFYNSLDLPKKRQHFHAFMNETHQALFRLQGQKNPMEILTQRIADTVQVLFLDEFIVNDIADAMILAGLTQGLINKGVCLITSSNTEPDNLYKDGWQRQNFLPTIECLKKNTEVIHLTADCDYRREMLGEINHYITPITKQTSDILHAYYLRLSTGKDEKEPLLILNRNVNCLRYSESVLWIDCQTLCSAPRSSRDYLAIADRFECVILSDVPHFSAADTNMASRFTALIDVLYDQQIKLVISAETDIDTLYPQGKLTEAFKRTRSRVIEMTSER